MRCLDCHNEQFITKKVRFTPEVKDEVIAVIAECSACTQCGSARMNDQQLDAFRRATADAYRSKHGLLTSAEIVKYRKMLGMSQVAFAAYLNVGEASIKRWETCFIQDVGQDEHIRLKCDPSYAAINALQVESKLSDIYSGNKKFSLELAKNAILYLLDVAKSPLYLNKVLFYVDFLHFKKFGKSLTGSRFVPLEYGPCPDGFQTIFAYLEKEACIKRTGQHTLKAMSKPDMSLFDDQEKETLHAIYQLAKKDGGASLYELSHQEKAFTKTAFAEPISYIHAKHLLID